MERLSCCTYPLQGRPIDEALAAIAAAGFAKVDVLGRAPHLEVVISHPAAGLLARLLPPACCRRYRRCSHAGSAAPAAASHRRAPA